MLVQKMTPSSSQVFHQNYDMTKQDLGSLTFVEKLLYEKNIQLAEKSGFQIDSDSSVC